MADKSQCKDIDELDPYCLEKVVEEKIGCKVPWSHTDSESKSHCLDLDLNDQKTMLYF